MISKLNALKKRIRPESALALTLESERLAVSLATPENGGREIASIPLGADAIASDPEKAGKELAAALTAAGVRERRCVVCVPPDWALTASADLPEMATEDLRGYLELRAEREFPIAADEMRLAHFPYALPDGKRRTTLAAIPLKRMQAVETMLAVAGCRAVSISLALEGCLSEPKPALHFLANGTHTNVIVTAGGGVVSMRLLASPGPTGETPFDAAAFYREIRITLGRLPETIRQQVREARFGGTPASAQRLRAATSDQLLGLGIESVDPAGDKAAPPQAAVQAAQRYLGKEPVAFEFVVPEVKKWEVMLKRLELHKRTRLITIVAAVILLPILAFFIRGRVESHYQSRWDGMQDKVADLDILQQKIHKFQPWFEPAPLTLQTLESLMTAFPEQGDVWAKSIEVGVDGKITCTAFAKNQSDLLALKSRLSKRPGVTEVQILSFKGDNPVLFTFTFKCDPRQ